MTRDCTLCAELTSFRLQNIDVLTLTLLGLQVVLFFALPLTVSRYFFLVYFALWRLAYNCGLGYVLRKQSETKWIVRTVVKQGWMDAKRRPKVQQWIKGEMQAKMGKDYEFDVRRAFLGGCCCLRAEPPPFPSNSRCPSNST